MYMFGGMGRAPNASMAFWRNDLWVYRFSDNSWEELIPPGTPPSPRYGHSTVWDHAIRKMHTFGGFTSDPGGYVNDLFVYDASDNSWERVTPSGDPPCRRSGHSAVWDSVQSKMYVFGGIWYVWQTVCYGNDIWVYAPLENSWKQLTPEGAQPPARCGHTAVWDSSEEKMYVFGGAAGDSFWVDLWAYSPGDNVWEQLKPSGTPPAGRTGHVAAWDPVAQKMYVFGGSVPRIHKPLNDLWSYAPSTNSWERATPVEPIPKPLWGHSAVWCSAESRLCVFGGCVGEGVSSSPTNDLWVYAP